MAPDADLVRRIQERRWFHTIDLGGGLVTNGDSPSSEIIARSLPDVHGKSVLDIGAWDGKYSFEAEAAGASRVVALDHYVWRLDPVARQAYYDKCEAEGMLPDPEQIDSGFLVDDGLPGKAGFDMAHEYLASHVEAVVDDFTTMDLDRIGQFDVVFYFGVLYHMVDPIGALKRVRRVTKDVAVIETAGTYVPGYPDSNLVEFFAGDELHSDYGNWFAPSEAALRGMCRAAGFRKVESMARTEVPQTPRFTIRHQDHRPFNCRLVAHAYV
jgi:tRNA (mo5U34)-methyltransferase